LTTLNKIGHSLNVTNAALETRGGAVLLIPFNLEYELGLIEKQVKRLAELTTIASSSPIKAELTELVRYMKVEVACLRHGLKEHFGICDENSQGAARDTKLSDSA
jgi:hypothetical protein